MYKYLLIGFFFSIGFMACVQAPDYEDTPYIEFVSMSKNAMNQGSFADTLFLIFNLTDGDGDLGVEEDGTTKDIVLIDNRTGNVYDSFKSPLIPEQGTGNGIEAEFRLLVLSSCCVFPDAIPPCSVVEEYPTNQLSFDIYITDRAGNQSNVITTPEIELICN